MQYAIEKHESDDVGDMDERSETFLDHLVKLTTGSLYILVPQAHRGTDWFFTQIAKCSRTNY